MNTLDGFAGAYGGLFSSTVIVVMLILEVARPAGNGSPRPSSGDRHIERLVRGLLRHRRLGLVPQYKFEDRQLLAGIPLGLLAAIVVTLLVVFIKLAERLFGRLKLPGIAKSALGGAVFGLAGVILPLTMFTGSDQLKTVLADAGTLGVGLLVVLVIAKILTFVVSQESGYVGGLERTRRSAPGCR